MGASALGGGRRLGDALDLGLLGGLAGNHRLDALDREAHGADLVAAARLRDLGVDLAARHALQDLNQAAQRPCDADEGDQDGAEEPGREAECAEPDLGPARRVGLQREGVRDLLRVGVDVVGELDRHLRQPVEGRIDRSMDESDGLLVLVPRRERAHFRDVPDEALRARADLVDLGREGRKLLADLRDELGEARRGRVEPRVRPAHLLGVGLGDGPVDGVVELEDHAIDPPRIGRRLRFAIDQERLGVVDRGHLRLRVPDAAAHDRRDHGDDGDELG